MYHVPLYQAPPVRRMRRWTRWSERLTILCLCKEGKGDLQVASCVPRGFAGACRGAGVLLPASPLTWEASGTLASDVVVARVAWICKRSNPRKERGLQQAKLLHLPDLGPGEPCIRWGGAEVSPAE